jgi:hypothetical protein
MNFHFMFEQLIRKSSTRPAKLLQAKRGDLVLSYGRCHGRSSFPIAIFYMRWNVGLLVFYGLVAKPFEPFTPRWIRKLSRLIDR